MSICRRYGSGGSGPGSVFVVFTLYAGRHRILLPLSFTLYTIKDMEVSASFQPRYIDSTGLLGCSRVSRLVSRKDLFTCSSVNF